MKQEPATEKQIRFANKLREQLTGENNYFKDTKLSKFKIGQKIQALLEQVNNSQDRGKVIEFPKR